MLGAQAGFIIIYLKLHDKKMFGIFKHRVLKRRTPLVRGLMMFSPHSAHNRSKGGYPKVDGLDILLNQMRQESPVQLLRKEAIVMGHPEYDRYIGSRIQTGFKKRARYTASS